MGGASRTFFHTAPGGWTGRDSCVQHRLFSAPVVQLGCMFKYLRTKSVSSVSAEEAGSETSQRKLSSGHWSHRIESWRRINCRKKKKRASKNWSYEVQQKVKAGALGWWRLSCFSLVRIDIFSSEALTIICSAPRVLFFFFSLFNETKWVREWADSVVVAFDLSKHKFHENVF